MKELYTMIARVRTQKCVYLLVKGNSTFCTCKDNLIAHGISDAEAAEMPVFTMQGLLCCAACGFDSGYLKENKG